MVELATQGLKPENLSLVFAKPANVSKRQPVPTVDAAGEPQAFTGTDPVAEERAFLLQVRRHIVIFQGQLSTLSAFSVEKSRKLAFLLQLRIGRTPA